jgi:hypothetical protein
MSIFNIRNIKLHLGIYQHRYLFLIIFFIAVHHADAATLTMNPTSGTFVVGSVLEVPVFVDTEGEAINAIQIEAKFPADKLQLISPSTGQSIITLWTQQPSYDNQKGTLSVQGVIPNGITTGKGLVTTMSFRVKAPGDAYLKFYDNTRVLKHDGLGTDLLRSTNGAVYHFILPPPAGPIVASKTHPDPYVTYRGKDVFLSWIPEDGGVESYSYILSDTAIEDPDNTPEGSTTELLYHKLSDGKHYFHIKSYRAGAWGGTTHFAISIDATPPAEFPVNILPDPETIENKQVVVQFASSDEYSGIDHYEIKVIPLNLGDESGSLFTEAASPYVLAGFAHTGKYDVIVRAYDKAGNYRDEIGHMTILHSLFGNIGERGIKFSDTLLVPWWLILLLLFIAFVVLFVVARDVRLRHNAVSQKIESNMLPMVVTQNREQLEEKQKQYTKISQLVIILCIILGGGFGGHVVRANTVPLEPPIVSSVSRNIGNDEIFYIGGTTMIPDSRVLIYIQNTQTGETFSEQTPVDAHGEWFYRHTGFLSSGQYIIWAVTGVDDQLSPPSPQIALSIHQTAIQIGSSRLSYEFVYGALVVIFMIINIFLLCYITYHQRQIKKKHERWRREVGEVEESVRTGFAILKRDIEAELHFIRSVKMTEMLRTEEVGKEQELLKDLAWVEQNISKEVFDIEKEL